MQNVLSSPLSSSDNAGAVDENEQSIGGCHPVWSCEDKTVRFIRLHSTLHKHNILPHNSPCLLTYLHSYNVTGLMVDPQYQNRGGRSHSPKPLDITTQAWKQTSGDPSGQTWNYRGITLLYNFTTALLYMVSSVTMARIVARLLNIY